jgi:hypothetical protein
MELLNQEIVPHFHSKFKGDAKSLVEHLIHNGLNKEVNGPRRGTYQLLKIKDLKPLESQRNATASWVKKALKLGKGFDRIAAGLIQVAKTPEGEYLVWDGCGRLALGQAVGIEELDCWVTELSVEEAAHYFVYVQKISNRSLKPNELFINAYQKGERSAVEFGQLLQELGMRIQGADDYWIPRVPINQRHLYPECRERSVIQAMRFAKLPFWHQLNLVQKHLDTLSKFKPEDVVKFARDTIVQANWNDDTIRQDLLPGLVIVYKAYPEMMFNGMNTTFRDYWTHLAQTKKQAKLTFKHTGGNLHNQESQSVAIGIISEFRDSTMFKASFNSTITEIRIKEYIQKYLTKIRSEENE